MADNKTKVTILLRGGAHDPRIELEVFMPAISAGNGVVAITSGGQHDPVALVPVDLLESVVVDDYRAGR